MKKLLLTLVFPVIFLNSFCQTAPYVINQNHNGCCGGGAITGSSFKVFGAGQIDSIRIYPRHNQEYTSTIKIFKGNGPNPDSLLATQSFEVVGTWNTQYEKLIKFTSPVVVKKDSVYTFYIEGTPIRYETFNYYADGSFWDNNGENLNKDVDFIIYIGTVTTTAISHDALNDEIVIQTNNNGRSLHVINSNKNFQLKLYNTNGLLISEGVNNEVNLPALSEAVYILQLSSDKEYYTRKIYIKQ